MKNELLEAATYLRTSARSHATKVASARRVSVRPKNGTSTVVPNVLIVEDDHGLQDAYRRQFGKRANIIRADTYAAAQAVLASPAIDVVVVDLRLPDGNGAALVDEIRSQERPLPVFVVTGVPAAEVPDRFRAMPGVHVVEKTPDAVGLVVSLVLGGTHP